MKKTNSIGFRIVLSVGVVVFLVQASIFFQVNSQFRKIIDGLVTESSIKLLKAQASEIDSVISFYQGMLEGMSRQEVFLSGTEREIEETVDKLLYLTPDEITSVYTIWPDEIGRAHV